jgi:hypothetical protein
VWLQHDTSDHFVQAAFEGHSWRWQQLPAAVRHMVGVVVHKKQDLIDSGQTCSR